MAQAVAKIYENEAVEVYGAGSRSFGKYRVEDFCTIKDLIEAKELLMRIGT